MSDRFRDLDDSRPARRSPSRYETRARRRLAGRPTVEALEGRALLSTVGSPDFTYAPGSTTPGYAAITFQPAGGTQLAYTTGEAMQSDGKEVVVGSIVGGSIFTSEFIEVTRLNSNGTTDATFGTNGVVSLPAPAGQDTGQAVAIQSDGKIVVAADVSGGGVAVYRLNTDGSLDTSFSNGGISAINFVQGTTVLSSEVSSLAIQPDGKILIVGDGESTSGFFLPALARLNIDGTPDSTFGTAGQELLPNPGGGTSPVYLRGVAGLVVQTDGTIDYDTTILSAGGSQIAVGQLNADGSVDATFDGGGRVILADSSDNFAGALAIQSDGKLIVGGGHTSLSGGYSTSHLDVYRLNSDGSYDTTFGVLGEATAVPSRIFDGPSYNDGVNSILIQSDGKIVVAGTALTAADDPEQPTVVVLNADGSPDGDFGNDGVETLPGEDQSIGFSPTVYGLATQANGQILVTTNDGVARLLTSGASNDFDEDGKSDPAVLLPNFAAPIFAYRPSTGGADVLEPFGIVGAGQTLPAPGAYDGSGVDELAVYLPSIGAFGIRPFGTSGLDDKLVPIGLKGDGQSIPASADYTGSGFTEIGVYEPSIGAFVYSPTNSPDASLDVTVPFGAPGAGQSIPVPADYDGSGHDEIAVYLPTIAAFAYRPANGGSDVVTLFGAPGAGNSIPVPGDYDGSGHTEVAVYLPALGAFAYRPYGTSGSSDVIVPFGMPGAGNSIPMPGDYDGSGHTELAVYMPSLNAFAYRPYGTDGSADVIIAFGEPGAGNTVPFNAAGTATIQGGGTGGGGSSGGHASAIVPGWVDFVPDLASQPKKGATQGHS